MDLSKLTDLDLESAIAGIRRLNAITPADLGAAKLAAVARDIVAREESSGAVMGAVEKQLRDGVGAVLKEIEELRHSALGPQAADAAVVQLRRQRAG